MTKSSNNSNVRKAALQAIASTYGYISVEDMYEDHSFMLDSVVPGICLDCSTVEDSCEPDAQRNWCSDCGAKRVVAVTVLAGVV